MSSNFNRLPYLNGSSIFISILLSIWISLGVVSCKSFGHDDKPGDHHASIDLPEPLSLDPAELNSLQTKCNEWYAQYLDRPSFNGGIIVAKNGNIVFEKYRGEGKLGSGIPFNENTPVHIASVSKTFTAMAVLYLYQQKKLDLEAEFSTYFPGFPYPGVTVKSLLNHRSGLPNYTSFMEETNWDKSKSLSNEELLQYLTEHKKTIPNISSPDRHFTYCNTNYALLALLIEKISGESYADFLQHHFFEPLQMKNSFVRTVQTETRVMPSYEWNGALIKDNYLDQVYGDKNIYSTARDLLIWDRALRSELIFKPAILEMAYTAYSNEKKGSRNYGLGWRMIVDEKGKKLIYHNGWWHGNNSSFIRPMETDGTIIVLGSRFNKAIYKAKELVGLFEKDFEIADDE